MDEIIMGVLNDKYPLYDLDGVYGTSQKYEVISAGEKRDKIFAIREIRDKESMLGQVK